MSSHNSAVHLKQIIVQQFMLVSRDVDGTTGEGKRECGSAGFCAFPCNRTQNNQLVKNNSNEP
jgi:hypothetical protein